MSETTTTADDARDRLLKAWRGEIQAGRMYELIAHRLPEREADILLRMAAAEASHRSRIEARMRELEVKIPAESSVRISTWMRLQARIAPVDRLLAARECGRGRRTVGRTSTGADLVDRPGVGAFLSADLA
jgi:rubrerythrin